MASPEHYKPTASAIVDILREIDALAGSERFRAEWSGCMLFFGPQRPPLRLRKVNSSAAQPSAHARLALRADRHRLEALAGDLDALFGTLLPGQPLALLRQQRHDGGDFSLYLGYAIRRLPSPLPSPNADRSDYRATDPACLIDAHLSRWATHLARHAAYLSTEGGDARDHENGAVHAWEVARRPSRQDALRPVSSILVHARTAQQAMRLASLHCMDQSMKLRTPRRKVPVACLRRLRRTHDIDTLLARRDEIHAEARGWADARASAFLDALKVEAGALDAALGQMAAETCIALRYDLSRGAIVETRLEDDPFAAAEDLADAPGLRDTLVARFRDLGEILRAHLGETLDRDIEAMLDLNASQTRARRVDASLALGVEIGLMPRLEVSAATAHALLRTARTAHLAGARGPLRAFSTLDLATITQADALNTPLRDRGAHEVVACSAVHAICLLRAHDAGISLVGDPNRGVDAPGALAELEPVRRQVRDAEAAVQARAVKDIYG